MSDANTRFVWFEHLSDKRAEARRFYGEVLPWEVEDARLFHGGGDEPYPMIKAGETPVGGFAPLPKAGVPPHWVGYLSVKDVDAAAKKIVAGGGKALMDAFDVPQVGRMQPVADPQGGALFLFKSAEGDSPKASGPGTFHWNELWADDPAAAAKFYAGTLGLETETMDMPDGAYHLLKSGDAAVAGIMKKPDAAIPTHWLPYIEVADADAAIKRARRNGAELSGEILEVPGVGRFGIIRDPVGASIGLIKPAAA
jgi:hypothetical protein